MGYGRCRLSITYSESVPRGVYVRTEEHRRINSESHKGIPAWNEGQGLSADHRAALAAARQRKWEEGAYRGRFLENGYWHLGNKHGHPMARHDGTVAEHRYVLYEKVGPGEHGCHWDCGRILVWGGLGGVCADHLDQDRANNVPENLVVSCMTCNLTRHRRSPSPEDRELIREARKTMSYSQMARVSGWSQTTVWRVINEGQ